MSINSFDGNKQDLQTYIGIAESSLLTMKRLIQFKTWEKPGRLREIGTVIRYDEYCLVINLVVEGHYFSRTITLMSSGFNSQNSDNSSVI